MTYLVDANIFLSAYQRDYPAAVFPRLWRHFGDLVAARRLLTINRVEAEVLLFQDDSSSYFTQTMTTGTVLAAERFINEYARVIAWSVGEGRHYKQAAIDDFAQNTAADAWLVAAALSTGHTILTQELSEPDSKRRIKIPDACIGGAESCGFVQFLKDSGYRG